MFISIKKKTILILTGFIVFVVAFSLIVSFAASAVNSAPKNGIVVVIDAGHGGIDGGVAGKSTGVKESDINLAIARSLKHFLEGKGYTVVMTRSTTDGLYGMTTKNRKSKDMAARKQVINEAKPDLVVSIHQNSYPRAAEHGAQVFYRPKSNESKSFAESMQKILNANLESDRVSKAGDYYILQCNEYPAILVECGFLSNPQEEKLLVSASYQEKVAYTIFTGIHATLGDGKNTPQ